jgi:murein DD-endopeptidase MepM/ murein hydrolase activator NlpD
MIGRRPYLYAFLVLDALLFTGAYLILGQIQVSDRLPFSDDSRHSQGVVPATQIGLSEFGTARPKFTATMLIYALTPSVTKSNALSGTTARNPATATRDLSNLVMPAATLPPTIAPIPVIEATPSPTEIPLAARVYTSPAPECIPHGWPVDGILSQYFSWYHTGIDIVVPIGTNVKATHGGQVVFAGWRTDGYGNLVIVQNGQFITYYAHNSKFNVTAGQFVNVGESVAQSGSTGYSSGPHVHYEVRINNVPVDPLTFDPDQYDTC